MTKRPSDEEETPGEGAPDEKKPCLRYEHCQDPHHTGTAEDLRRCRKDGRVRCKGCRQDQKRKEDAVGTRGLDLAAHFRSKQLQQRHLPAVEVVVSSPSDDDIKETKDATKPVVDFAIDPAAPLKIEEESTTDVPNTSPSSPSSNAAKKKPKKREALGKGVKCLHIGCDAMFVPDGSWWIKCSLIIGATKSSPAAWWVKAVVGRRHILRWWPARAFHRCCPATGDRCEKLTAGRSCYRAAAGTCGAPAAR